MGLSFVEKSALTLRGVPVGRIEKVMETASQAGISVTVTQISTHLLCRGSIEKVVEALVMAVREKVSASWDNLCAIDLAGKDVVSAVRESSQAREAVFSTFAADMKEPISGFCRDGSRVVAECRISYRPPISHVFGSRMEFIQERLAARIGAYIFDAASFVRLQMSKSEHEASLLVLAQTVMATVSALELKYSALP